MELSCLKLHTALGVGPSFKLHHKGVPNYAFYCMLAPWLVFAASPHSRDYPSQQSAVLEVCASLVLRSIDPFSLDAWSQSFVQINRIQAACHMFWSPGSEIASSAAALRLESLWVLAGIGALTAVEMINSLTLS